MRLIMIHENTIINIIDLVAYNVTIYYVYTPIFDIIIIYVMWIYDIKVKSFFFNLNT